MNLDNAKRLLFDTADILEERGVPFLLACGTALGAYRHNGFIPWDNDVDIAVKYELIAPQMNDIALRLRALKYKVNVKTAVYAMPRILKIDGNDCHMDVAAYFQDAGQRFCSASGKQDYSVIHPESMFEQKEQLFFCDRKFFVPTPIEEYLTEHYGPDFRVPKDGLAASKSQCRVYKFRPGERYLLRNHPQEHLNQTFEPGGYYEYLSGRDYCDRVFGRIAAHIKSGERVLDVCCATGLLAGYLTPDIAYTGFDGSDTALETARQEWPDHRFIKGRIENFPYYHAGRYSTIVFSACLFSMILPEYRARLARQYADFFGAEKIIISDLQQMDTSDFRKAFFALGNRDAFTVDIPGKGHNVCARFVEAYRA